jgi:o-succinylbenzoate---CoA ligase
VTAAALADVRADDLVAVRLPPGPAWAPVVEACWRSGATIFPVDHRLPKAAAAGLVALAAPTVTVDAAATVRRRGGTPDDPAAALLIATSGTTAAPQLVHLRRRAVEAAVRLSAAAIGAGSGDPWLCCLPPAHIGGLLVVLRSVLLGAPVVVQPSLDAAAVAKLEAIRFTSVVPTMLDRLLDAGVDLTKFARILVGGGPLWPELRERAERAGARLVETYGLTESCGGVVYDGRPLEGVGVRLSASGSIELSGPTLMDGYRFDAEASEAVFTSDGWLRTDDEGEFRADGRLEILGRADDVIISGGEKIRPDGVEAVLRTHPKVADVAVAGRDDRRWGRRVVAFVVPTDPDEPPSLDELRAAAGRVLPRFGAPREIVVVPALPRTALGKLRRSALPS